MVNNQKSKPQCAKLQGLSWTGSPMWVGVLWLLPVEGSGASRTMRCGLDCCVPGSGLRAVGHRECLLFEQLAGCSTCSCSAGHSSIFNV